MSHTIGLKTELREEVGKGQVKVLRRAGYVPGNVYGGGMTSTAIKVQSKALDEVLRHSSSTTLVDLEIGSKEQRRCLIRNVQYGLIKREALHVDFFAVNMDSLIRATIHIVTRGESPAARGADAMLLHPVTQVHVEGRPGDLPEEIVLDISGLTEIDQAIHARDLKLPNGVTLLDDPDEIIVKVQLVRGAADSEAPVVGSAEESAASGEAAAPATRA